MHGRVARYAAIPFRATFRINTSRKTRADPRTLLIRCMIRCLMRDRAHTYLVVSSRIESNSAWQEEISFLYSPSLVCIYVIMEDDSIQGNANTKEQQDEVRSRSREEHGGNEWRSRKIVRAFLFLVACMIARQLLVVNFDLSTETENWTLDAYIYHTRSSICSLYLLYRKLSKHRRYNIMLSKFDAILHILCISCFYSNF